MSQSRQEEAPEPDAKQKATSLALSHERSQGGRVRQTMKPLNSNLPKPSIRPGPARTRPGSGSAPTRSTASAGSATAARKTDTSTVQRPPLAGPHKPATSRHKLPAAEPAPAEKHVTKSVARSVVRGRGPPRARGLATVGAAPLLDKDTQQLHPAILRAARQSGQLNLSSRGLVEVPEKVWSINEIGNEEAKQLTMSMGESEERWWDQVPLTKLLLCGNQLTAISDDLLLLSCLQTLDVHDNALASLPAAVSELPALVKLAVSHNKLTALPAMASSLCQLLADHNQLTQLPEQLGDCLDLELLDVAHNQLTALPLSLGYLHKVNRLNASDNRLEAVEHELGDMRGLRHLELARNQLHVVPESLGQLAHLQVLDLRQNQLTELPPLTQCVALKELLAGHNQIKELSIELLESLKSLVILDLSNNKIESLPDEVVSLQRLERLDLSNNDLSTAPLRLCLLPLLKSVQLEGNTILSLRRDLLTRGTQHLLRHFRERLQGQAQVDGVQIPGLGQKTLPGDLPPWETDDQARLHEVYKMKGSRLLSHSGHKLTHIPDNLIAMGAEAEVTSVDLSKNLLTALPDSLLSLSGHLSEMNISSNRLTSLPSAMGQCCHLTYINVSGNQLSALPDSLVKLKSLREVCLSLNRFTTVPPQLYEVTSLEILLASDNQIAEIEVTALARLSRLATLDLRNNSIAHVPARLGTITQLRSLSLEGNLFKQPRPTILSQGTATVLEYLRDRIPAAEREP